jgi:hypothetical protein
VVFKPDDGVGGMRDHTVMGEHELLC